jgi:S1-C subfamily serine protease
VAVIAGNGHVEYGQGIARRLARRLQAPALTVVQSDATGIPTLADFVLRSTPAHLPDPARLGVSIEHESTPAKISGFSAESPAERAGLRTGDAILAIADIAVNDYYELRAAMHGRRAGEVVKVGVRRQASRGGESESVEVTLY